MGEKIKFVLDDATYHFFTLRKLTDPSGLLYYGMNINEGISRSQYYKAKKWEQEGKKIKVIIEPVEK